MQSTGIPLAKAIQDLRAALLDAVAEGKGKELRFKLKPIELELDLAISWDGDAHAQVKFWVIDLGGKAGFERTITHKLKLSLDPVDSNGNEFMVSDKVARLPD